MQSALAETTEDGKIIPVPVKVGDTILMDKYSGQEVTIDDEEFVILKADDIIAIIKNNLLRSKYTMAAKNIKFKEEARQKIPKRRAHIGCCRKSTLVQKGATSSSTNLTAPQITKDGVTVAKEIELEDKHENMGAQMVKEVASKTADKAGDGTTTATVLAEAIYSEGLRNVTAGANPMEIKRGIEKAVKAIVERTEKTQQTDPRPQRDRASCYNFCKWRH